ncbi:MAG: tetratricopeptide repeat protein [Bdellovibrionales bacterium]
MKLQKAKPAASPSNRFFSWRTLIIFATIAFASSIFFPFIALDDAKHIWQNPYVMNLSWANFKFFWFAPYYGLYAPVIYDTWMILAELSKGLGLTHELTGITATLFHILNVLLHLFNILLVWFLFSSWLSRATANPHNPSAVFVATLAFAIHPLQAEAVVWASGLKDTWSASLILLAILSFTASLPRLSFSGKAKNHPTMHMPAWFYKNSIPKFLTFAALAMLTKPIAVVLPVGLMTMLLMFEPKCFKKSLPLLAPVLFFAFWVMWLTKSAQPNARLDFDLDLIKRPLVALASLGFYMGKIILPFPLAPDYGLSPPRLLNAPLVGFYYGMAALYVFFLIASFFRAWPEPRTCRAGLLLMGFGFGPVLGLIPFEFQNISTVADRYFYLFPALGLGFVLNSFLSSEINARSQLAIKIVSILWALLTIFQTSLWANNDRLFSHTTRVNPESYLSYNNLGLQALRRMDFAMAEENFRRALSAKPDYLAAVANLGVVYFKKQDFATTVQYYQNALAQLPSAQAGSPATFADMYYNMGAAQLNLQQTSQGVESLKRAALINPDHFMTRLHLGRAYALLGQQDLAKQEWAQALRLQPNNPQALMELKKLN